MNYITISKEQSTKIKFNSAELSKMLIAKRKWRSIGLRDAAKDIGISAATLSRIENGKLPDLITCKKVCNWIHIDIDYFFK